MTWRVEFLAAAERDLELIEEHLFVSYQSFGEGAYSARVHALQRVEDIALDANRLVEAPFIGAGRDDLDPGLRQVTLGRAVFYFLPDPVGKIITVKAVFFGGQDHTEHILKRYDT